MAFGGGYVLGLRWGGGGGGAGAESCVRVIVIVQGLIQDFQIEGGAKDVCTSKTRNAKSVSYGRSPGPGYGPSKLYKHFVLYKTG